MTTPARNMRRRRAPRRPWQPPLATGACRPAPALDPSIITVGIRTAPNTLDPRQAGDEISQRVAELIFSPLFVLGPDLKSQPHLAVRLDNPDPLTYVVHLRRGVRFHDGHELTSADVVYTYSRVPRSRLRLPLRAPSASLQSVTALDDYTVEFRLKEPFAAFPMQLAGVRRSSPPARATPSARFRSAPVPTAS